MKTYLTNVAMGGSVISAAVFALYYALPSVLATLDNLLTRHPYLTTAWGLLAIVGIDRDLVALRDGLSYNNVGAKAAAHLFGRKP